MAYKVFSNGDALTGSELNTYLMNQSVMVFASTTARDAALTAPTEGMVVWLQDANKYVYYIGSAWADLITPASSGNAIINGAFDIWQRGTSQTITTSTYCADRYGFIFNGTQSVAVSAQTFTPGTAPVAGYEGQYFARLAVGSTSSGMSYNQFGQPIEDVRTFAGQTITFSFWAKATSGSFTVNPRYIQFFGSGGSSQVEANFGTGAITLTTSWTRYTATVTLPSIAGKTIGTGSSLKIVLDLPQNTTWSLDTWGWQVESGSTATAFKRNASNIQGELAACKRYLPSFTVGYTTATGWWTSATQGYFVIPFDVEPRVAPTGITVSALSDFQLLNTGFSSGQPTAISWNFGGVNSATIITTHTAGSPTAATGGNAIFRALNPGSKILFTGCEL